MYEAGRIRVSDADREAIVARLTRATEDGRLTLAEFGERSAQAYASRTWGELSSVVDDLPEVAPGPIVAQYPPTGPAIVVNGVTNTFALIGMVLGVVSLATLAGSPVGPLGSVAAIVFGVLGLRKDQREGVGGRGLSWAAIWIGLVGFVLPVAGLFLGLLGD